MLCSVIAINTTIIVVIVTIIITTTIIIIVTIIITTFIILVFIAKPVAIRHLLVQQTCPWNATEAVIAHSPIG